MEGLPLDPPTEEERQDAIRILEAQPQWEQIDDVMGNVSSEFGVALGRTLADRLRPLVEEAERIHHECSL
jgi:hypothetical protein